MPVDGSAATTLPRDQLLRLARQLAERCGPSAGRQAAAALAVLRARGLEGLRGVLASDVDVHLGVSSRHWSRFREACAHEVERVSTQGVPAVAFLLAWIARSARADRGDRPPRR